MRIAPQSTHKKIVIDKYDNNGFLISGNYVIGPILISENGYFNFNYKIIELLSVEKSLKLIDPVDILLIGKPGVVENSEKELNNAFDNINIEFMQTGSCCRTYNLLIAENRRVGAIIFPLKEN